MLTWNEYLTTLVKEFRSLFEKLNPEEKSIAQRNLTFIKPCQIEVVEFKTPFQQILFVTLDNNRPDMEFIIHEKLEIDPQKFVDERLRQDIKWLRWGDIVLMRMRDLPSTSPPALERERVEFAWSSIDDKSSVYFFGYDVRSIDPGEFALRRFRDVAKLARDNLNKRLGYKRIERTTTQLRKDVEQIVDKAIRTKLLDSTDKIERSLAQIKRIDEYEEKLSLMEQEIGGVRKLIGVTKEFQDWRVLASEVEVLKKTHVGKEVFDSEIRRLDQGIQGLHKRIDDIKAIKIWTKRTIIDILLAIAAIIATLYAAGLIHF